MIALENQYIEDMQTDPYQVEITWVSADEMARMAETVGGPAIEKFVDAVGEEGQALVDEVQRLGEGIELKY